MIDKITLSPDETITQAKARKLLEGRFQDYFITKYKYFNNTFIQIILHPYGP